MSTDSEQLLPESRITAGRQSLTAAFTRCNLYYYMGEFCHYFTKALRFCIVLAPPIIVSAAVLAALGAAGIAIALAAGAVGLLGPGAAIMSLGAILISISNPSYRSVIFWKSALIGGGAFDLALIWTVVISVLCVKNGSEKYLAYPIFNVLLAFMPQLIVLLDDNQPINGVDNAGEAIGTALVAGVNAIFVPVLVILLFAYCLDRLSKHCTEKPFSAFSKFCSIFSGSSNETSIPNTPEPELQLSQC